MVQSKETHPTPCILVACQRQYMAYRADISLQLDNTQIPRKPLQITHEYFLLPLPVSLLI